MCHFFISHISWQAYLRKYYHIFPQVYPACQFS